MVRDGGGRVASDAGLGAGHASGRIHPAGRHAVDQGGRDDLRRLHLQPGPTSTDADGNTITPTASTWPGPTSTSPATSRHIIAFRITPDITRENFTSTPVAQRKLGVPPEVRVRPVQPGRLDDEGVVGPLRHPADAVDRLHGKHLPVPFPGHDVHRARGLPDLVGQRRVVPLQLRKNYGDVHVGVLQRRRLREAGGEQPAGVPDPRHAAAFATQSPVLRGLRDHRLLRRRQLHQERREDPRDLRDDLRAQVPERRVRLPAHDGSDPRRRPRGEGRRLLVLVHAEDRRSASRGCSATTITRRTTSFDDRTRHRTIVGVAYWFKHQGT